MTWSLTTSASPGYFSARWRWQSPGGSGRAVRPWPWTLNIAGDAHFTPDRDAMFAALMTALQNGQLRVDGAAATQLVLAVRAD